ncbi:MAG: glycosyltransferase family 4 protein [Bacteroidales bacterium]|nr:glycosyltransferase family 4 protein [Bacteroidales bacterium]
MRVLFDNQIFDEQRLGGISRYISILANKLPDYGVNTTVGVLGTNNVYLREVGIRKYLDFIKNKNRKYFKYVSKYSLYDLFHPTYYNPHMKRLKKKPMVLTVHDMIYELFPEQFYRGDIIIQQKKDMINRANRLIAISENTKKDIINILGVSEEKIDVIHHGLMWNESLKARPLILPFSSDYILFVGDRRAKYKCFKEFVIGVSGVVKKYGINIITTGTKFTEEEFLLLKKYGIADITYNFMVNENELLWLYQNAVCFIFPSSYEGFGLPILEAFKGGCPTILSSSSCFPEIARDSVLYFEAENPENLSSTLVSLLDDSQKRADLRAKGFERLKYFSISKMIEQTKNTYYKTI